MDTEIVNLLSQSMWTAASLSGPILVVSLVIGLVIGLVQSVIQVQEPTLTFVPKLIGVGLVLVASGNWMLVELTDHWVELLGRADDLIRMT